MRSGRVFLLLKVGKEKRKEGAGKKKEKEKRRKRRKKGKDEKKRSGSLMAPAFGGRRNLSVFWVGGKKEILIFF